MLLCTLKALKPILSALYSRSFPASFSRPPTNLILSLADLAPLEMPSDVGLCSPLNLTYLIRRGVQ
jgi:hypothetical protein